MVEWYVYFIIAKMIDIVDNWLPEEVFYKLFSTMKSPEFPWFLGKVVGYQGDDEVKGNMQFFHEFYRHHQMKNQVILDKSSDDQKNEK